jgi:hypothetical protein
VIGVVEPTIGDVDDDACAVAGVAGKSIAENVCGSLGLDTGDPEAVVEVSICSTAQGDDGDRGDEPEADHSEGVAGAVASQTEK